MRASWVCACAWICFAVAACAADAPEPQKPPLRADAGQAEKKTPSESAEKAAEKAPASVERLSVTHHVAAIQGEAVPYTATAGYLQTQDAATFYKDAR